MLSDTSSHLNLHEKKMYTTQSVVESLQLLWKSLYLVYFVGSCLLWLARLSFKFIRMTKILIFQISSPRDWLTLKIYFICRCNILQMHLWINLIFWTAYSTTLSKVAISIQLNQKFVNDLNLKGYRVKQYSMGIINLIQFCYVLIHPTILLADHYPLIFLIQPK